MTIETEQQSAAQRRAQIAALQQRFKISFGTLEERALIARSKAIIGTDQLPATPQGQLALSGLTKLRSGADPGPTPAEFAALEYMIRATRPAPLVTRGFVEQIADGNFHTAFPLWESFRAQFAAVAGSIGRLSKVASSGAKLQPQGTAFLVAEGTLMTNAHVLDALSNGVRALEHGQAVIEMHCEASVFEAEPRYPITGVAAVHETQDACLLRVDGLPMLPALPFSASPPSGLSQVAAVGFPYPDLQRDPLFVAPLFGMNHFGMKRVAPGLITGTQSRTGTLYHDCSTLGGNSGSPLLSLSDCTVIGLHRGGGFLWKNLAVQGGELIDWLSEELARA